MAIRACDACPAPATWLVFAAYDTDPDSVHPRVARYPAAQIRACDEHLAGQLTADAPTVFSTRCWVIKPVGGA